MAGSSIGGRMLTHTHPRRFSRKTAKSWKFPLGLRRERDVSVARQTPSKGKRPHFAPCPDFSRADPPPPHLTLACCQPSQRQQGHRVEDLPPHRSGWRGYPRSSSARIRRTYPRSSYAQELDAQRSGARRLAAKWTWRWLYKRGTCVQVRREGGREGERPRLTGLAG